ncbi:30S ribosomal protein S8 [Candidatus Uhrbacteria bacterium]|nr:30S ribosomal protein S8 [Candidatus Uhrbacteria bacterium]
MMTDPIADMLTRVRNAQSVGKSTVVVPSSKLKHAVAELLAREGWLARVEVRPASGASAAGRTELVLTLRYHSRGTPVITNIRRVSRPGRRVYVTHGAIPRVRRGLGTVVLSTPQGLLTNAEARARGIGGEVICEIY